MGQGKSGFCPHECFIHEIRHRRQSSALMYYCERFIMRLGLKLLYYTTILAITSLNFWANQIMLFLSCIHIVNVTKKVFCFEFCSEFWNFLYLIMNVVRPCWHCSDVVWREMDGCLKTKILCKYSSLLSNGRILSYTYVHTYIHTYIHINNHRSSGLRSNHRSFIATVPFRMVRNCRTTLIRQLQCSSIK